MIPDPHPNFSWLRYNLFQICIDTWILALVLFLNKYQLDLYVWSAIGIAAGVLTFFVTSWATKQGWFKKP